MVSRTWKSVGLSMLVYLLTVAIVFGLAVLTGSDMFAFLPIAFAVGLVPFFALKLCAIRSETLRRTRPFFFTLFILCLLAGFVVAAVMTDGILAFYQPEVRNADSGAMWLLKTVFRTLFGGEMVLVLVLMTTSFGAMCISEWIATRFEGAQPNS
jgi:hypothetical protein